MQVFQFGFNGSHRKIDIVGEMIRQENFYANGWMFSGGGQI